MTTEVHTLAGAYAVDALERDERAFFERHLATCESCQREVAELQATAALLGAAAEEPPPAHLRDRVLTAAAATPQLPPAEVGGTSSPSHPLRRLLGVAAAVAIVAALGISVVSIRLADRLASTEAELAEVQARVTAAEELAAVLAEPDSQVAPLEAPAGARAQLVSSEVAGRAVLVTDGLARPAEDLAYQAWILRDGVPMPDRVFRPDPNGRALIAMEGSLSAEDLVAVTVEPADGSAQPTGDIVIQGPVDI